MDLDLSLIYWMMDQSEVLSHSWEYLLDLLFCLLPYLPLGFFHALLDFEPKYWAGLNPPFFRWKGQLQLLLFLLAGCFWDFLFEWGSLGFLFFTVGFLDPFFEFSVDLFSGVFGLVAEEDELFAAGVEGWAEDWLVGAGVVGEVGAAVEAGAFAC